MHAIAIVFSPVSAQAYAITHLIEVVFAICAAIFLLVAWLVVSAALRFRDRGSSVEPTQVFGSAKVEIAWTAAPLLLLAGIFALTVAAARASDPDVTSADQLPDILLIGHQWWWEVWYPRLHVVTANEIHMPTERPMVLELRSADVIHDFWVPQLGRKMDMVPGRPARLRIEADTAGTYAGACAEYCGAEHAWMRLRVVAEASQRFDRWAADQQRPAEVPVTAAAVEGSRLFTRATCANCHAIAGTDASARVGPDLTHVASRQMLAGEVLPNTRDNLARWINAPETIKPASHMPNLHLSAEQVSALTTYMEALR